MGTSVRSKTSLRRVGRTCSLVSEREHLATQTEGMSTGNIFYRGRHATTSTGKFCICCLKKNCRTANPRWSQSHLPDGRVQIADYNGNAARRVAIRNTTLTLIDRQLLLLPGTMAGAFGVQQRSATLYSATHACPGKVRGVLCLPWAMAVLYVR
jgi:hypothetical protein